MEASTENRKLFAEANDNAWDAKKKSNTKLKQLKRQKLTVVYCCYLKIKKVSFLLPEEGLNHSPQGYVSGLSAIIFRSCNFVYIMYNAIP